MLLDKPITWASAWAVGLGLAGEYSLLSLIEDYSVVLKVTTLICAVGALFVLEFRVWLDRQMKYLFVRLITTFSIVYVLFIGFALYHWIDHTIKHNTLSYLYIESGDLIDRKIPLEPGATIQLKQEEVDKFIKDTTSWEDKTSKWLLENIGPAARERFADKSAIPSYCWGPFNDSLMLVCDFRYDVVKNRLVAEKRNLSALMETSAYE